MITREQANDVLGDELLTDLRTSVEGAHFEDISDMALVATYVWYILKIPDSAEIMADEIRRRRNG